MSYTYPLYCKWRTSTCIARFDTPEECTVVVGDDCDAVGTVLTYYAPLDASDHSYWLPLTPLQLASLLAKENHAIQDITSSDI